MGGYELELQDAKNKSQLNNFNSLVSYLSSFYKEQLKALSGPAQGADANKKQPVLKLDEIQIAKQGELEKFAALFSLSVTQFLDNYNNKQMVHFPPSPSVEEYKTIAYSFVNKHKQYSSV